MSQVKEIIIEKAPNGFFFAKFVGGGQVPDELLGSWTRYKELERRINSYLSKRKANTPTQRKARATKGTKNG